jgi:hypothetical protein
MAVSCICLDRFRWRMAEDMVVDLLRRDFYEMNERIVHRVCSRFDELVVRGP